MKNKKNELTGLFWCIILGSCFLLIILVAIGFAVFSNSNHEVVEDQEHGGEVVLNYSSSFPGLTIADAIPMTDDYGMKNFIEEEIFDFSVETTLDEAPSIEYEISIVKDEVLSTVPDEDIRIYLEKEESGSYIEVLKPTSFEPIEKESEFGSEEGSMVLYKIKKTRNSIDNYRLRIWISDSSTLVTGTYSVKVYINGEAK